MRLGWIVGSYLPDFSDFLNNVYSISTSLMKIENLSYFIFIFFKLPGASGTGASSIVFADDTILVFTGDTWGKTYAKCEERL